MSKRKSLKMLSLLLIVLLVMTSVFQAAPAVYAVAEDETEPVGAPSDVTAAAADTTAVLRWAAPVEGPVPTGYVIFRDDVQVANVTSGAIYTDISLTSGTSYNYKIQAYTESSTSSAIFVPVQTGNTSGNQPPVISAVYPPDGDSSYAANSTIYLMTSASDSDGSVQKVRYYSDGVLLGDSNIYGIKSWYNAPQGVHEIAAVAVDNSGNTATKIFYVNVGTGGNTLRQLYRDTQINTWNAGTTSIFTAGSSTEKIKEGNSSLKIKNNAGNSIINYQLISTGLNVSISPDKDNVALQFWMYIDTAEDAFRQNAYVSILSMNSSNTVECRLPLSNYISSSEKQQWKLVTIPMSDFYRSGTYVKNGTVVDSAQFKWGPWDMIGAGFVTSTTGLPDTSYFIDDFKYVNYTVTPPPPPPAPLPTTVLDSWLPYNVKASTNDTTVILNWNAPASDPVPTGYLVLRNDVQVANVTSGMSYTDSGLTAGTAYIYKLKAYNDDNISNSVTIPVETGNTSGNQPPVISAVYPPDGDSSYAANSTIYLMTSASDSDGSVQKVRYYSDGVLLGDSNSYGTKSWYNAPQGVHEIAAVAVDNSGNTSTKTFYISVGNGGNTLRQLYRDAQINTSHTGTTSLFNANASSTEKVKEGNYSLKIKNLAGNDLINYQMISTGLNITIAENKENVALQFWMYIDTAEDIFRQNAYVSILCTNSSTTVESRLPLSNYISSSEKQQWKLVTIPMSDFYRSGTYVKNGTVVDSAQFKWGPWDMIGAGFVTSTTGLPDTSYFIDDFKYVTYSPPVRITSESLDEGAMGIAMYAPVNTLGGVAPFAWSATGLPLGVNIKPESGELYGTPNESGLFTVHLAVTDSLGITAVKDLHLKIYSPEDINNLPAYEATVLPQEHQTIKGWGVTPGSWNMQLNTRTKALDAIFNDLGITMFRAELKGDNGDADGNVTDYMESTQIPYLKMGISRGITQYELTIWTPPAGMKDNGSLIGTRSDGTGAHLLPEKEAAFVRYVVNSLDRIKSNEVPLPVALSFANEPSNVAPNYPQCVWSGEQYRRVAKMLRKAMDDAGYRSIPLIGSEGGAYKVNFEWLGDNFSGLDNDEEFRNALGGFATHAYHRVNQSTFSDGFKQWVQGADKYSEKDRWQTEYSHQSANNLVTEMDRTIVTARTLTGDVAWAGMNYWFWWGGWDSRTEYSKDSADEQFVFGGDGITTLVTGKLYELLKEIFKNVPVGSTVKRLSTNDPAVKNELDMESDMVAFQNGETTIAMLINSSTEDKVFNINGLTGTSAKIKIIGNTDMQQTVNISDGTVHKILLPARTINIIETTEEDIAPPTVTLVKSDELLFDGIKYITRNNSIEIRGSVNEPSEVKVNGEAVTTDSNNNFSTEVLLTDTINQIRIDAADIHGNILPTMILTIEHDPDYVAVNLDKISDNVSYHNYVIKGKANVASQVDINGTEVSTKDDLTFECPVTLAEGQNHFTVIATDSSGNMSSPAVLDVYCDSVSPEITILNSMFETEDPEYVLSGKSSEGLKSLMINGKVCKLRDDLTFMEKFDLAEGENTFVIKAMDPLDNASLKEYKVTYTKTASTPHYTDAVSYVRRADEVITVDGILDEADWVIDNKANKVVSSDFIAPNNIMNFGTLWDEQNLYVAARVYDDRLAFGFKYPYNNDAVEVFVNPTNSKAGTYSGNDKQLFIGYGATRDSMYVNSGAAYQTGWKDLGDGYTVEMAIPWSSLGLTPEDGMSIGFDIQNDDKDISANRENAMVWAGIADDYKDTSKFGTLILTTQKDVPYIDRQIVQSVDTTAPTTEISLEGQETGGVYISDVSITLSAADNMSGVDKTEYRIGESGNWSIYTGPIILSNEGDYIIQYRSADKAGIVEDLRQQTLHISKSGTKGGGNDETPPAAPTVSYDENTDTVSTEVKATLDGATGKAEVKLDSDRVAALLSKAAENATKVMAVKIGSAEGAREVEVVITGISFVKLSDLAKVDIRIETKIATMTFDKKSIDSIRGSAAGEDVSLSIKAVDKASLPAAAISKVGDRPVFDFTVKAGGIRVSSFGNGNVDISIPYSLRSGEKKNFVVVYYIDDAGKLKTERGKYDEATGTVKFTTKHFSTYAVSYNPVSFNDVKPGIWYDEALGYMAARNIVNGIGGGRFAPENNVSRADFLIMVMNAYGIDTDIDIKDNFSDAGNKYYTGYLGTAKRIGLISGTGDNKYSPEASITRQDMLVILYHALEKLGELPEGTSSKSVDSFIDKDEIDGYAKSAMKLFVETGIITGDGRNMKPKAASTRAEAVTVLYRLLSK